MSGTLGSNHISAKNKLNEESLKILTNEDSCFKENHSDSIHNINKSVEVDGLKDQVPPNEVNWKSYIKADGDDSFSIKFNSKKKKKIKKKSDNLISGDNCDVVNNDEGFNDNEKEVAHNEKNSEVKCNDLNGDYSSSANDDNDSNLESSNQEMKAALSKVGKLVEHLGLTRSNAADNNQVFYYGVHIPNEPSSMVLKNDGEEGEIIHVYTDKVEALKVVKQFKKARFKQFKSEEEALYFSINGDENLFKEPAYSCVTGGEKIMSFKCPKVQDMVKFRKAIECGDVEVVRKKIWENPRYLVSNGDTPSILQEGCRYNALHIAAKAKNVEIARLILDCITNIDFICYLYDDNDVESCKSRIEILLDLYLNMPDKGLNETPLHLSVKYGAVELVELLTSYPQCQRNLPNKYHQTPKEIICSRVSPENKIDAVVNAISTKLDEQYFIPVLRYEDNSMQTRVGKMFSPSEPLRIEEDPLSPRIEIQAFAGPMSKGDAEVFQRKWRTPSRTARTLSSPLSLRLCDAEKGLERIGRDLANEFKVPWKEYWSFLGTFVDLSTEDGLQILENYLKKRFEETLQLVNNGDGDDSIEEGCEVLSPMSDLCEALKACTLSEYQINSLNQDQNFISKRFRRKVAPFKENEKSVNKKLEEPFEADGKHPLLYVERSCEVFGRRIATAVFNVCSSADIYKIHTDSLRDALEPEVKHLLSLITSYREDLRFQSIDFQLVHSRVASVAVQALNELITDDDKKLIFSSLKEIDLSDGTLSDDEDQNYNYRNFNHDLIDPVVLKLLDKRRMLAHIRILMLQIANLKMKPNYEGITATKQQLHCLVKHLMDKLQDSASNTPVLSTSVRTEADCHLLWAAAIPCCCSWNNSQIRTRPGAKRKSFKILKSGLDCDFLSRRKVLFEEEKDVEDVIEKSQELEQEGDNDDYFSTPPSESSDSGDEVMEDPMEIPDTFIFPGSAPTKTDFAVLDAIEKMPLSSEKYPNIYRWRHLVQLYSKPNFARDVSPGGWHQRRLISFNSSTSSPCKLLNVSISSCDSPRRSGSVEPWERITGPYTPRRAMRPNSRLLDITQESPIAR